MPATPYLGQIIPVGFNFQPRGWAFCDGRLLDIAQNDALYALLGTTYGGDGQTTFGLPDLRGRVPIHMGTGSGLSSYTLGEITGAETVTLTSQQIPQHAHVLNATGNVASYAKPGATLAPAQQSGGNLYATASSADTTLVGSTLNPIGGNQPHENMQPFLCVNFVIALEGVFPSQN